MKRLLATIIVLAGAVALSAPLAANDTRRGADKQAFRQARKATTSDLAVSGEQLKANIEKLDSELDWHDDSALAMKAAKKADKPVFLLQVLGDRCGHV
ncbi:MAG: hypothetical protein IPK87_06865 [Planctomycetes bacterium]|nr:hypothetical protein [Planctomycetota bacterium]